MLQRARLTILLALVASVSSQQVNPQLCAWYKNNGISVAGCNKNGPMMPATAPGQSLPSGVVSNLPCSVSTCIPPNQCLNGVCVINTPINNAGMCGSNMVCASNSECLNGQCVPLGGNRTIIIGPMIPAPPPSCATMMCATGTTCIEGRGCVANSNTNTQCAANEQFMQCSGCETVCGQPAMACPAICGPSKCQCATTYARDPSTGKCIPQAQCSTNNNGGNHVATSILPLFAIAMTILSL